MKITPKHGYVLFGVSFFTPNFGLDYIGMNLAVDSVLGGGGGLLDSPWRSPLSLFGLSLFFLNFTLIPGAEIKKGWRKVFIAWPWTVAFIPQIADEGRMYVFAMVPPFLLWAISISLINYLKMKEGQNQSVLTTSEAAPPTS